MPQLAVGAVVVRDARLLLIKRAAEPGRGYWSLPGGRVEPHESVAAAVERELREETGLVGKCGELIGVVERRGPGWHFVILDYAVSVAEGQPRPASDAADAAWAPLSELGEWKLVDGLLDFLTERGVIESIS